MFKPGAGINGMMVGTISFSIERVVDSDGRDKSREDKVGETQRRSYEDS